MLHEEHKEARMPRLNSTARWPNSRPRRRCLPRRKARARGLPRSRRLHPVPGLRTDRILRLTIGACCGSACLVGCSDSRWRWECRSSPISTIRSMSAGGRFMRSPPSWWFFRAYDSVRGAAPAFGMLALNGLPRLNHPVFAVEIPRASRDRFFLCVLASDEKFDPQRTRQSLRGLKPLSVELVNV